MSLAANNKKDYESNYRVQSAINLKRLREEVAKKKQCDFAKEIDIPAPNLSTFENGSKTISLNIAQNYITYFRNKHDLELSLDYLFGFSKIMKRDLALNEISCRTGLSEKSILMLEFYKDMKFEREKPVQSINSEVIKCINLILETAYEEYELKKENGTLEEFWIWTLFNNIYEYIYSNRVYPTHEELRQINSNKYNIEYIPKPDNEILSIDAIYGASMCFRSSEVMRATHMENMRKIMDEMRRREIENGRMYEPYN